MRSYATDSDKESWRWARAAEPDIPSDCIRSFVRLFMEWYFVLLGAIFRLAHWKKEREKKGHWRRTWIPKALNVFLSSETCLSVLDKYPFHITLYITYINVHISTSMLLYLSIQCACYILIEYIYRSALKSIRSYPLFKIWPFDKHLICFGGGGETSWLYMYNFTPQVFFILSLSKKIYLQYW